MYAILVYNTKIGSKEFSYFRRNRFAEGFVGKEHFAANLQDLGTTI
jgi:hypothetical protein